MLTIIGRHLVFHFLAPKLHSTKTWEDVGGGVRRCRGEEELPRPRAMKKRTDDWTVWEKSKSRFTGFKILPCNESVVLRCGNIVRIAIEKQKKANALKTAFPQSNLEQIFYVRKRTVRLNFSSVQKFWGLYSVDLVNEWMNEWLNKWMNNFINVSKSSSWQQVAY